MVEEELYRKLSDAVISGDKKALLEGVQEVIKKGMDPLKALESGLLAGIRVVGERFEKLEIFLSDMMMAAEALRAGMDILLAGIPKENIPKSGTVVIGTVKGDIHTIGKSIVAAMLTAHGLDVHDIGVDVPASKFIEAAKKYRADIIGVSALMTSSIGGQKDVIDYLKAVGERENFIVMVGGGATTKQWADEIGADGYAETAAEAAKLAVELVRKKKG